MTNLVVALTLFSSLPMTNLVVALLLCLRHIFAKRCDCWAGWGGGDCSERICPTGVAWSDEATSTDNAHGLAVCSNRGECNHETGRCSCMGGFSGAACERSNCPRGCSGHGHCRSMSDYAKDKRGDESIQYLYDDVRLRSSKSWHIKAC